MSFPRKQAWAAGLLVLAALLAVGCSGRTTGATDVDSTSATLNAVGSCDQRCYVFMRWRADGDTDWTNGAFITVPGPVTNVAFGRKATGLRPNTRYSYQVCGKEASWSSFVCVGPDGSPDHSSAFTTLDERVYQQPGQATFRVPSGVTRVAIELSGAAGGGGQVIDGDGNVHYSTGGRGARVRATLAVNPGDVLGITVGGRGGNGTGGVGGSGGSGGGGAGGGGGASATQGGGGGGASDVRKGSGLDARVLVAGGGGGGGSEFANQPADHPGGDSGADAPPGDCRSGPTACDPIPGGGGGTATAGGAGSGSGGDGELGLGGSGGSPTECGFLGQICFAGGGGGGGLFGGGGGASGSAVNSLYSAATGGGGGSSFVTAAALCSSVVQGVREGDGLVRIVFPAPSC